MQIKKNILFVINPISGGKGKSRIPGLIDKYLDKEKFNSYFSFTEYVGHAAELAEEAANKNFDIIVAAGGDGTINEVAAKVMLHNKILGILPLGSGNGLARFLNLSKNLRNALFVINAINIMEIDTASLNNKAFFNMAGIGFDARLSAVFSGNKKRGFSGYLKEGVREILNYKAQQYILNIDGVEYKRQAFAISIANSSQYGNNVFIAPDASVRDGLLDICIIKPFPLYKLPKLSYVMLTGRAGRSDMIEIIKGRNIKISRLQDDAVHLDGEPLHMGKSIDVNINPLSLQVIVP